MPSIQGERGGERVGGCTGRSPTCTVRAKKTQVSGKNCRDSPLSIKLTESAGLGAKRAWNLVQERKPPFLSTCYVQEQS